MAFVAILKYMKTPKTVRNVPKNVYIINKLTNPKA